MATVTKPLLLDETGVRIAAALEIMCGELLAPLYDPTSTYETGDNVQHGGVVYEANQDILTPEPWTAAHWDKV